MFVCTMVLLKYMQLIRYDVHNISGNMHGRSKIYREFYHVIVYIANEGCLILYLYDLKILLLLFRLNMRFYLFPVF